MLHDSAGNALLSSMNVPILKIMKLISKSLQYEGDIFACISETDDTQIGKKESLITMLT